MMFNYYLIICLTLYFVPKSQACFSKGQQDVNVQVFHSPVVNIQEDNLQEDDLQEESILEFALCPKSNPYVKEEGKVCCKEHLRSRFGCGESVDCPSIRCENADNPCDVKSINFTNMSPKYDGEYLKLEDILEANRPIFQRNETCIWWHRPSRHWSIGPCENVGSEDGFAYIENDDICPFSKIWQRNDTHETIPDIDITGNVLYFPTESSGQRSGYQSGIAAVNVVISRGIYKQQCKFKYRNGIYKCTKN